VTLGRFSWTGKSWTLSDYLRASTAAHYCGAHTHSSLVAQASEERDSRPVDGAAVEQMDAANEVAPGPGGGRTSQLNHGWAPTEAHKAKLVAG